MKKYTLWFVACALFTTSCSLQKQLSGSAEKTIRDSSLLTAHVGISIFDADANRYLYNYQGDKYFVPASNTKIPTCYAAMKYLGDSIPGLEVTQLQNHLFITGTGDPTLLHEDFKVHPVYNFLKSLDQGKETVWFGSKGWEATALGSGWAWNDFDAAYMVERSSFPVYGNIVTFSGRFDSIRIFPKGFKDSIHEYSVPGGYLSSVTRSQYNNRFNTYSYGKSNRVIQVPFITSVRLNLQLFEDSLKNTRKIVPPDWPPRVMENVQSSSPKSYKIFSQPTDSLLKPMMHRSDNFFAEQSLLMVSNEALGVMNDAKIIDTILKTDFKDLPQRPRWADGSGLSRYNLFTPQDFVIILQKMKNEFGMDRIKEIFPTGGEGTLSSYYKSDSTFIYAKTGTLSGVVALSGFLYTKKNKQLIFSVLVNNHNSSATAIRRAVERFLQGVRNKY
ncbi:MAG: D-alanyl-D-alanine carboxypeptidase/D-alanyl-D-alanine-endopeptidase [Chitinophagaceae bacterium]